MKKEILAHNSEMVDIMLKELKEYVKSKILVCKSNNKA